MKENNKLVAVLQSIAVIALGVLVAIFGIRTVDLYFGILLIVAAVGFLALTIALLAKTKEMQFAPLAGFTIALTFGIMILAGKVTLGYLIYLLVILVIGLGGAFIIYGIYIISKKATVYGVGVVTIGALMLTAGILYLTVPEFGVAFWIIVGVLIACYGVLMLVEAIAGKKLTKK